MLRCSEIWRGGCAQVVARECDLIPAQIIPTRIHRRDVTWRFKTKSRCGDVLLEHEVGAGLIGSGIGRAEGIGNIESEEAAVISDLALKDRPLACRSHCAHTAVPHGRAC